MTQKVIFTAVLCQKYFGYSFDSGEQMAYFKPMLKDKKLTMCQDVTPNTSEAKEMMYAIAWNEAGNKMIQVALSRNAFLTRQSRMRFLM